MEEQFMSTALSSQKTLAKFLKRNVYFVGIVKAATKKYTIQSKICVTREKKMMKKEVISHSKSSYKTVNNQESLVYAIR